MPGPGPQSGPLELPVPDPVTTPDQREMLRQIQDLFRTLRLSGTVEMSRVRRATVIGAADWMFCLRGIFNEKPGPYAVFVKNPERTGGNQPPQIVHYRAAVQIDDCDRDQYEPMENFTPPPDQRDLLEKIEALTRSLKLTGIPEMSRVRRASAFGPSEWVFCLRGSFNERPGPYAVYVKHAEKAARTQKAQIVLHRPAIQIDDCDRDRYEPVTKDSGAVAPR
jgi:hypothetical protein